MMTIYTVSWCLQVLFQTAMYILGIYLTTNDYEKDPTLVTARVQVAFIFFDLLLYVNGACLDLLILYSYNKYSYRLSS